MTSESWATTDVKLFNGKHTWSITNFSLYPVKNRFYLESTFPTFAGDGMEWFLFLYPNGDFEDVNKHVSVALRGLLQKTEVVCASVKLYVINAKHEKIGISTDTFEVQSIVTFRCSRFLEREFLLNKQNKVLCDDTLTICCELSYIRPGDRSTVREVPNVLVNEARHRLHDDLANFLKQETLKDITLVVSNVELHAHKAILAARSPVFSAMFEHEMKEQKTKRVEVTDVDFETFSQMLQYIYTDKVQDLKNVAQPLLQAADKYALDDLKLMCETELCSKLCINNAMDMLILADMHNAEYLKARAMAFINSNEKELINNGSFKTTYVSHPELITEMALQRLFGKCEIKS